MPLKPLENPTPTWTQMGKKLLDDMKEPGRYTAFPGAINKIITDLVARIVDNVLFMQTVEGGSAGGPARVDSTLNKIAIRIIPGAGASATVETTISGLDDVISGTADWSAVAALTDVDEELTTVIDTQFTAIRVIATAGDVVWEARTVRG